MPKHLLPLMALAAFWAVPVAAQRGAASADSKWHSSPCKSARAQDHAQPPTAKAPAPQAPAAEAPGGSYTIPGWLSFFGRPSSPLLP